MDEPLSEQRSTVNRRIPKGWVTPAVDIALGLVLLFSVILVWVTVQQLRARPVLEYTSIEVESPSVLCPGDQFVYKFSLDVRQAPSVVMIARSIWSIERLGTVGLAVFEGPFVWTEGDERIERTGTPATVPPLPAGSYEFRVAAIAITDAGLSTPSVFSIPFSVPPGCGIPVPADGMLVPG